MCKRLYQSRFRIQSQTLKGIWVWSPNYIQRSSSPSWLSTQKKAEVVCLVLWYNWSSNYLSFVVGDWRQMQTDAQLCFQFDSSLRIRRCILQHGAKQNISGLVYNLNTYCVVHLETSLDKPGKALHIGEWVHSNHGWCSYALQSEVETAVIPLFVEY